MYRFFVKEKIRNGFQLSNELLNHIKVLRLKKEEQFYCVYDEKFYICHLERDKAIIDEEVDINNECKGKIVLFASIINIKKFEWLVQKSCELGVLEIYPMITKNANKKYIDIFKSKIERLQEIAKNACEQSFRNKIAIIHKPIDFNEAIKYEIKNKFLAHEKEELQPTDYLFEGDCAFFVGPEGGFTDEEVDKANSHSISIISLGKRILRAETASVFLLSRIKD